MRAVAGLIVGIVVAFGLVALLEPLNHMIFDLPKLPDPPSDADRATYMDRVSLGAELWQTAIWFVAPFLGGLAAARISRAAWPAGLVAALFLAATVYTFVLFPHPVWMIAAAVFLVSAAPMLANRIALPRS